MSLYSRLGALAGRSIAKYGGTATLERQSRAYDAATGKTITSTVVVNTTAVLKTRELVGINGELIAQTVAILTAEPIVGDAITIGARRFTVQSVEVSDPTGSQAIVYKAVLK